MDQLWSIYWTFPDQTEYHRIIAGVLALYLLATSRRPGADAALKGETKPRRGNFFLKEQRSMGVYDMTYPLWDMYIYIYTVDI